MPVIASFFRRFVYYLDRFLVRIYIRSVEVEGVEHVPLHGPLILVSNHLNNADPPMVAGFIPRHPTFMAKQEMFGWPVLGAAFRLYGAFPVRRFEADLAALRKACEVLRAGEMLVMFPEGTRSRTGGLQPAHPGTAIIALRSRAPILPVAITGTEGLRGWPWMFLRPFLGPRVRIVIGKPFFLPEVERADAEAAKRCTDIIMRRIAELLPERYRGVYAGLPVAGEDNARELGTV